MSSSPQDVTASAKKRIARTRNRLTVQSIAGSGLDPLTLPVELRIIRGLDLRGPQGVKFQNPLPALVEGEQHETAALQSPSTVPTAQANPEELERVDS